MPLAQALDVIGPQASAELLFVDDGSSDRTPDMLAILAGLDARPLSPLVRNFGKEAAIAAVHARAGRPWCRWTSICRIRRNCCPPWYASGSRARKSSMPGALTAPATAG
jgi:hypothetical protein